MNVQDLSCGEQKDSLSVEVKVDGLQSTAFLVKR